MLRWLRRARTTAAFQPTFTFRALPHVLTAEQGGQTVLLDPHRGRYFSVDTVGSQIWEMIRVGASVHALVAAIHTKYGVEPVIAQNDIEAFLRQLLERRLAVIES